MNNDERKGKGTHCGENSIFPMPQSFRSVVDTF